MWGKFFISEKLRWVKFHERFSLASKITTNQKNRKSNGCLIILLIVIILTNWSLLVTWLLFQSIYFKLNAMSESKSKWDHSPNPRLLKKLIPVRDNFKLLIWQLQSQVTCHARLPVTGSPPLRALRFNFSVQSQCIGLKFCVLVPHPQTQK